MMASLCNLIYNFLIFTSGVDRSILRNCYESEHKKYALQGGLVLIPTIFACISLSYATRLFVEDNSILYTVFPIIGAGIIFIIDRYIVSTYEKNIFLTRWQNIAVLTSIKFWIRILFALWLGIIISHPVVLYIFNDEISRELHFQRQNTMDSLEQWSLSKFRKTNLEVIERKNKLKDMIDSLNFAIIREERGLESNGYYPTSAIRGRGPKYSSLINLRNEYNVELFKIESTLDSTLHTLNTIIKSTIDSINHAKVGYMRKTTAFNRAISNNPEMRKVSWILIGFFILVDITAVLLKAFTNIGEYDYKKYYRDKYINDVTHKKCDAEIKVSEVLWSELTQFKEQRVKAIINDSDISYTDKKIQLHEITDYQYESSSSLDSNTQVTTTSYSIYKVVSIFDNIWVLLAIIILSLIIIYNVANPIFGASLTKETITYISIIDAIIVGHKGYSKLHLSKTK